MFYHKYGLAMIRKMLQNIGLFCKRPLQKRPIFCKETYILKHHTNHSHPKLIEYYQLLECPQKAFSVSIFIDLCYFALPIHSKSVCDPTHSQPILCGILEFFSVSIFIHLHHFAVPIHSKSVWAPIHSRPILCVVFLKFSPCLY